MQQSRFEQARINQLIGLYSPDDPPRLALDFGDYLSLVWRLDTSAGFPGRERYYRLCAQSLCTALNFKSHPICRMVDQTPAGQIYAQIPNLPYRSSSRFVDAKDRKAALTQLMSLRGDTLRIGTYNEGWDGGWPGGGILDTELRERVFAVLFTALQGQYTNFGRLLLVIDIVIANLIFGIEDSPEVQLSQLISDYGYPDPRDERVRREFNAVGEVRS
jgi:hypothetical protein